MTIDLTDTTTGQIQQALTQARHRLGGRIMGVVLTLVIGTDEALQYDAIRAAGRAAREHPCLVLGVIKRVGRAQARLDAEIRVGENGPGETVLLRLYGPLGEHADSVVAPLLAPDTPVVTWWPGNPPSVPAADPLGTLAQRRVTDVATAPEPTRALAWRRITGPVTPTSAGPGRRPGARSSRPHSTSRTATSAAGWWRRKKATPVRR